MKTLLFSLIFAVFLFFTSLHAEREIHSKHFFFGIPKGSPESNDYVFRDIYALSQNDKTKFADWVAYRLTPEETYGTLDLERKWKTDPFLDDSETTESKPDEYDGSFAAEQYHRGHLAPLGSFKGSEFASQVNFYSNIVPQKAKLNSGVWKHLEDHVRDLVRAHETVWVVCGPYYDPNDPAESLPNSDESHMVPSGFWKIVGFIQDSHPAVKAYKFPQSPQFSNYEDFQVSVNDIENLVGLDFLWKLTDDVEDELEVLE